MSGSIIEVAVYTVHDAAEGRRARDEAYSHLKELPGFLSWDRLISSENPTHLVDVVNWATHGDAQNASDMVRTDPRFSPFIAAIDKIISFGHYDRQV